MFSGYLHFSFIKKEDEQDKKLYKCHIFNPFTDVAQGGSYASISVTSRLFYCDHLTYLNQLNIKHCNMKCNVVTVCNIKRKFFRFMLTHFVSELQMTVVCCK